MGTITLSHLTKRYGDFTAVDDVCLEVAEGELLVLLGTSGSGKTTTLQMVNRLIEPTSGRVLLDGEDNRRLPPHELRRSIGYVFQQLGLFPHLTVAGNIGITPSLLGWEKEAIRERVDELLRLVELPPEELSDRLPDALSGGQQQRVAVARALAARPRVLLLDEPFGALDPLTRDRLRRSFKKIHAETGLTGIFVTHDIVEAVVLGDRIAVMHEGRPVQTGTPEALMRSPATAYVEEMMATVERQSRQVERLLGEPAR